VLDAMLRLDVSSAEVVRAIEQYANEREFERELKRYYEGIVDDSWDYWHEGNI
jgi:aminopeptidase N